MTLLAGKDTYHTMDHQHFQYSVMGKGILLRSLGWPPKFRGKYNFPLRLTLAVTL